MPSSTPAAAARDDHIRQREIGDVLITFEAETHGIREEYGDDKFETVHAQHEPAKAEFPVAVVDKVVDEHGTRALAKPISTSSTRRRARTSSPRTATVSSTLPWHKVRAEFPDVRLLDVKSVFGGWATIMRDQFGSDGTVDRLMAEPDRPCARSALPGLTLALGTTLFYLGLIVCLPIATLLTKAAGIGFEGYLHLLSSPRVLAALRLTVVCALGATAFNAVFGLAMAWALVRYGSRADACWMRWSTCHSPCPRRSPGWP